MFKTKTLAKFTRQHGISDAALVEAVDRAKRGLIDADLGGKVGHQAAGRSSRSRQKRRLSYVDRIRF
ncbi:type II toxin-antitoxin system RelE/ParE family toxin [Bradyrhizobium sp. CCGUVB23]|uniref:type II toxin-antitoxin system RelE/ParE family toxin n=1 Tax=Bradyrhizobium sp. CCGUVB23 TaxID=2949630 RepID=UPI003531E47E